MKKRMKSGNNVIEFNLGDYMQRGQFALKAKGRVLGMGQSRQRWSVRIVVTGEPDAETGDVPKDDYIFTPTDRLHFSGMIEAVTNNLTQDWGGKSACIDITARIV